MSDAMIITNVSCCARCGGDHDDVTFTKLTRAIDIWPDLPLTHWAMCRATLEPILMTIIDRIPWGGK